MKFRSFLLIILTYHALLILFPPKLYEPDETSYLYSGRNIIEGKYTLSLDELMPQIADAQEKGLAIGPNPLGYTELGDDRFTISKSFLFPVIVGLFDKYSDYRVLNLFFSFILIIFSYSYIRPVSKYWPAFLSLLYLNPACTIMFSRPLMSDFSSMVCIFLSFMSFYLILFRNRYNSCSTGALYIIFFAATLSGVLIRIPNVLLMFILLPFLISEIIKNGIKRHYKLCLTIILCAMAFIAIFFYTNLLFYGQLVWTGYHQTQNIRRIGYPFAFMKIISPENVNLKGILFRNAAMFLRDFIIAYPIFFIFLLIKKTDRKPPYGFLLASTLWIFFIFFQYKVPMNLHFIFILRMFLPILGFISLIVALNIRDRLALSYALIFMSVFSALSYLSFLFFTNTLTNPYFKLIPFIWRAS